MKQLLFTALLAMFAKFKAGSGGGADLAKLKLSIVYLKSVESCRFIFLSVIALGAALLFAFAGLVLFYTVLFFFMPWTDGAKIAVGLCSAAVFLGGAAAIIARLLDQDQWLKIFHADHLPDLLSSQAEQTGAAGTKRF